MELTLGIGGQIRVGFAVDDNQSLLVIACDL